MNSGQPQSIRTINAGRKHPSCKVTFNGRTIDLRKSVRCAPDELDALAEAAHNAGFGIETVKHDPENKRQFIVRFIAVPAYLPTVTKLPSANQDAPQPICERCRHWLFVTDEAGQCNQRPDAMTASSQTCALWQAKGTSQPNQTDAARGECGAMAGQQGGGRQTSLVPVGI